MTDLHTAPHLDRAALVTIDVQRDVLDGARLEIPGTSADVYKYYSDQPFAIFHFPMHWAWINGTGQRPSTHGLVAVTFGWNPFGGSIGPETESTTPETAPSKANTIPIDQLPKPPAKK